MKYLNFLFLTVLAFCSAVPVGVSDVTIPSGTKNIWSHYSFNRLNLYLLDSVYLADSTANTMLLQAPELADDLTVFTFPATNGTANYGLLTDGAGVTSWAEVLLPAASQVVTNKTIDADLNTITNIEDADIKAGANIARSKIAAGTADFVVINDGSGNLSEEAQLAVSRGGTGSGSALNNDRVMISSGGSIVEQSAITANRALASDASGLPVASSVTDTELGYLSGVTSSIQTQIDAKPDDLQEAYDGGNTIATSGSAVTVTTAGANAGIAITNSSTGQGLTILSNGVTNKGIEINKTTSGQALDINHNGDSTSAVVTIDQTLVTSPGPGLIVNSTGIGSGVEFRKTASGTNAIIFAENLNAANASPVFDLNNLGAGPHIRLRGNTTANVIETPSRSVADATATENITVKTGTNNLGTGDSGNIQLETGGSAGGTQGSIYLVDGSEGTIGDCWLSTDINGGGNWDACPTGLENIVEDTTPQLGGTLDTNGFPIGALQTGQDTAFATVDNTDADAVDTGTVFIQTGDKTAGTGDSGDISIHIGTSSGGSRGNIRFTDGSEGNVGDVWTSIDSAGRGEWQTPAAAAIPSGVVLHYAGTTVPSGWVAGDGSTIDSVSDTSFAALFTAIGTTYGGTGADDFNLPDCTGRVLAGKESTATRLTAGVSGVDGGTLGAAGGSQQVATTGGAASFNRNTMNSSQTAHSHSNGSLYAEVGLSASGTVIGQRNDKGGTFSSTIDSARSFTSVGSTTIERADVSGSTSTASVSWSSSTVNTSFTDPDAVTVQPTIVFHCIIKK